MSIFDIGGNFKKIFFIGIGGVSMSGLAEILIVKGFTVSGSDERASSSTERLASLGVTIHIGHSAHNITEDIELVVFTAAVKADNPEIIAAKCKGIQIIDRATLLGRIINNYETSIGVSGMHGKTTTTSMITEILSDSDATVSLGGFYKPIGGNFRVGNSGLFIFEACEYCDSFLKFFPSVGVILNIEEDHLDYFKDLAHIRRSFRAYAENIKDILVINSKIENLNEITDGLSCKVVTFGGHRSDYYAGNISFCEQDGSASFDIMSNCEFLTRIKTRLTGCHNIENTLAAYAACDSIGAKLGLLREDILDALFSFFPADRRFQFKGTHNGAIIVDDYAHHPTEIKMALSGAKNTKHSKIICLFQPHTYTRTIALFDEFAQSFGDADEVAFIDIYAAREKDPGTVSSKMLAQAVGRTGKKAIYFKSFSQATEHYRENLGEGDLFITMGAGDVYLVGDEILSGGDLVAKA